MSEFFVVLAVLVGVFTVLATLYILVVAVALLFVRLFSKACIAFERSYR